MKNIRQLAARLAGAALSLCLAAGASLAQYNPATQGKTSLYAEPQFQTTGQVIFYRGSGLCLSVQNAVFRDWTPVLLEACDGSPRQQFVFEGDMIRLAPNKRLCLDRQRIQGSTENGELNLENCSEQRTKWRLESGPGVIRGTSHVNYSICVYPQGNRVAAGVRMMAGPPGCGGGQSLGYGSIQQALSGVGPKPTDGGPPKPAQPAAKSFHVQVQAGLCIDVSGGRTMGGTAIQLWPCHRGAPQKFTIDAAQGRIRYAAKPDMCVDQEQGGGRKLELTECQFAWNRWSYDARNMRIVGPDNQCWDVPSGRFDQGQRLQVWACNNQPPQGFFYDN